MDNKVPESIQSTEESFVFHPDSGTRSGCELVMNADTRNTGMGVLLQLQVGEDNVVHTSPKLSKAENSFTFRS